MKIKIFYLTTDTKIGGTEQMLLALLSRLDKDKYSPFICAIKFGGPLIEEARKIGVEGECLLKKVQSSKFKVQKLIINTITQFFVFILISLRLAALLKKEKPDILHTFLFHANILGRIVGKLTGISVIISSQRSVDKWRKPWHSFLDRWTVKFCNLIISNSEAGRKVLIEREKIDPKKIITIHNGIDIDKFNQTVEGSINTHNKRREFGLEPCDIVIGIIANLREVKGHRFLFEALADICSDRVYSADNLQQTQSLYIKLLVVGDGKLKEELINLAGKFGIKDNVIFSGFRDDISEILKIIDIFVLPSLWEGFPVSIMEAMASKKPVIASNVGGIPELVIDGETGILVFSKDVAALKNAILKLINNPQEAKIMGENSRRRIEEYFSLDKMVEETEKVYQNLQ